MTRATPGDTCGDAGRRCVQALRDVYKHHGRHRGGRPSRRARAARPPCFCWFPAAAWLPFYAQIFAYLTTSVKQNASLIAQHCRIALFVRAFFPGLSKPNTGAAAVLVDEPDARQLKCPSEHSDSPKATREASILSFLGRIGGLASDCFPGSRRFGRCGGCCGSHGSGPSKANARLIAICELDTGCF